MSYDFKFKIEKHNNRHKENIMQKFGGKNVIES